MKKAAAALVGFIFCFLLINPLRAQETTQQEKGVKINWLSWQQATELAKKNKKKLLLDVYTDWCSWCKKMDEATFQKAGIAKYINANFYPVKFDAEYKGELQYQDKTYKFVKNQKGGYHELAATLLNGKLSFPSVVFLDEDMNIIQSIIGFKTPEEFEQIITYFAKDHHKETPWSSYQKSYKSVLVSDKH